MENCESFPSTKKKVFYVIRFLITVAVVIVAIPQTVFATTTPNPSAATMTPSAATMTPTLATSTDQSSTTIPLVVLLVVVSVTLLVSVSTLSSAVE